MNPRAAINDLLPFQGSPFSLLGTSPWLIIYLYNHISSIYNVAAYNVIIICTHYIQKTKAIANSKPLGTVCDDLTERVGFEPTRPCGQTVFKTASL